MCPFERRKQIPWDIDAGNISEDPHGPFPPLPHKTSLRRFWYFGDFGPTVAEALMCIEDGAVFEVRPGRLADVRVQMVVPGMTGMGDEG